MNTHFESVRYMMSVLGIAAILAVNVSADAADADIEFFEKSIRPVLVHDSVPRDRVHESGASLDGTPPQA